LFAALGFVLAATPVDYLDVTVKQK
jgi:hypothetical protein